VKNTEPDARQHSGARLAALLAGSRRERPASPEISEAHLEALTPLLIQSGSAGLAWRRIRPSELARSAAARELEDAYAKVCVNLPEHLGAQRRAR
jgi:hypothetical protein